MITKEDYLKAGYKLITTTEDGREFYARKANIYGTEVIQYIYFKNDQPLSLTPFYIPVQDFKLLQLKELS